MRRDMIVAFVTSCFAISCLSMYLVCLDMLRVGAVTILWVWFFFFVHVLRFLIYVTLIYLLKNF